MQKLPANLRSLIAKVLDIFKVLGKFAITRDDGSFDDVGKLVLLERSGGVRLKDVKDMGQE